MGVALIERVEPQPQSGETIELVTPEESPSSRDRYPTLREQVYFALFAAFNMLLAKLILSLDYFASIQASVPYIWATLLIGLSTLSLAVCYPPLLAIAYRHIREGRCSVEVLKALIIAMATVATVYALFFDFNRLGYQYLYQTLPWLILALTVEQYLFLLFEQKALENSEFNLLRLAGKVRRLEPYPDHAPVESAVSGDLIKPGDLFKLSTGEFVPCDGRIIEGIAELRERRYSGRPRLKIKGKGQRIFAGSELVQGEVLCEAVALSDDSVITSFIHALNRRVQQTSAKFEDAQGIENRLGLILIGFSICIATYVSGAGENLGVVAGILAYLLSLGLVLRALRMWAHLPGLIHTTAFKKGMLFRDEQTITRLAKIRDLILDVRLVSPPGQISVRSLDILDDRVERDSLLSIVLILLGNSDDEVHAAITEYARPQLRSPTLHKVSDVRVYENRGVCGTVGGVEFSVGTETFLVERGVQLQQWELATLEENETAMYVAMQDELVVRMVLSAPFTADAALMRQRLGASGVRAVLCSADESEQVDKFGKRAGFELASIFGGLKPEHYIEKLGTHSPSALLLNDATLPSVAEKADVTASFFDDVRWNLDRGDVVLFDSSLERLADVFLVGRMAQSVRIVGIVILLAALAICITLTTLGLLDAALLSPVLIVILLGVSLNHFRLLLP